MGALLASRRQPVLLWLVESEIRFLAAWIDSCELRLRSADPSSCTRWQATGGATIAVSANVTNDGAIEGKETVEAYAEPPGPDVPARLIGWSKIDLAPGATSRVTITADPRLVAQFEVDRDRWHIAKGDYTVRVGTSSQSLGDMMHVTLDDQVLPP